MTGPSPRPTREQVEAALRSAYEAGRAAMDALPDTAADQAAAWEPALDALADLASVLEPPHDEVASAIVAALAARIPALTVDAHLHAGARCPSVYGRNTTDSAALPRARDFIAEHFASVEGGDVDRYDATSYELAKAMERAGLLAARTPQPAEPLPWLTGAAPDETARVVADVKTEAVWLVLHMQANGTREDIQSALRTLRLVWGDPPPVEQQAAAAVAPQRAVPDGPRLDALHRALARRIGNLRRGSRKLLEISSARNAAHVALLDERDRIRDERDEARRIGADVARQRAALLRQIERSAPAIPDGEDVPAPLSDLDARQVAAVPALLAMCDEAERHTATHPVHDEEGRVRAPYLTTVDTRRAVAAAVPGEDARDLAEIRRIAEVHPDAPRGELLAEVRRLVENDDHCTSTHYALDGGDVPARLAAALAAYHEQEEREPDLTADGVFERCMRAAVAAALARTPHDEQDIRDLTSTPEAR